ncbi:MAG: DUF4350 domain-containing protein [Candidatus Bathyarchaeota archaeon]|nr:DUF4350 domain-containing protein [Candidatus Bathyarchaeota archaeon]
MRIRAVLLVSLALLFIASVSLTYVFPSIDDLWVENPFWNGLSEVYTSYKPIRLDSYQSFSSLAISPVNSTILMLGPSKPYTEYEVATIRGYLDAGGRVVLTDDFGTGNSLLQGLGLETRFSGELMQDTLFKEKKMMPKIFFIEKSVYTAGVTELVMNYPTVLNGTGSSQIIAMASFSSTLGSHTESSGPYPVMTMTKFGKGSIIAISDSSTFINSMIERGNNTRLLRNIVVGSAIIDETHSVGSRLTEVKATMAAIYAFLSHPEVKYSLAAVMIVGVFKVRWVDDEEKIDEVEEALKRHPEWDHEELEDLREMRRKAHGG